MFVSKTKRYVYAFTEDSNNFGLGNKEYCLYTVCKIKIKIKYNSLIVLNPFLSLICIQNTTYMTLTRVNIQALL